MLSAGANIKQSSDSLKKVSVEYLCNAIRNQTSALASRIQQLQIVRQLDSRQYALLKQQLPYFVCATFNPPFRRSENFAYTEYFIIDIDHISEKDFTENDIKDTIIKDPRTMICFKSPSGDGLKVIMKLSEKCYDAGEYTLFYKIFISLFSLQYGLEQVVDTKTCDITRACFMSSDSDIYYNPDAECVCIKDFFHNGENDSIWDIKREVEQYVNKAECGKESSPEDPDMATMERIKDILNPNMKRVKEKIPAYVPEILNELIEDLRAYIEKTGLVVAGVEDIHYGKKIKIRLGLKMAEVNLFYGKKGFSIVQSPKSGNNPELNNIAADLISSYIYGH